MMEIKQIPFSIDSYCKRFEQALCAALGKNVLYIGLQGSYLRGEATEHSDIDLMVILETLTVDDMDSYRRVLEEVGDADRACGFICSRKDLQAWNPLEACQLKYTTKDLLGTLTDYLPAWTMDDECTYIKLSLNNLYHALCHSYIHGKKETLREKLTAFYKAAFFILQNTYYLETCRSAGQDAEFVVTKAELLERLRGEDREVLETLLSLTSDEAPDVDRHFALLFHWCQNKQKES